jgi:hypothetical protein
MGAAAVNLCQIFLGIGLRWAWNMLRSRSQWSGSFAGAGAQGFWPGYGSEYVKSYKMSQKP